MVRHTLKILPYLLQDFKSVFGYNGALYIKWLKFAQLNDEYF